MADRKYGAVVGLTGLEPVTLRLSSACSNQLSYRPGCFTRLLPGSGGTKGTLLSCRASHEAAPGRVLVEAWGFEPQTYSLQSYRSTS